MSNVGWATLSVIPSFKGFEQKLTAGTVAPLAAAGKTGGAKFGDAAGREAGTSFRSSWADRMRGFAPFAGIAVGAGAFAFLKDAVSQASQAEQAIGGVRAVFEDYAEVVEARSEDAAEALGLSARAYQELVTVSGAMLKNKGIEDFAEQADNLVTIGADLAAQFGGDTRSAVEALNAALRGESDPIERYGVSLNETAVNAKLAAEGMSGLTGAALDQAKAQARLQIIAEQTADAQGAFARESETLAGQAQRLSAEWEEMKAAVGEELLPAMSDFVGFLRNDALPVLSATGGVVKDVVGFVSDLPGPVKAAAGAFVALRLASATGLSTAAVAGVGRMSSAVDTLRLRSMLAADAFRTARTGSLELAGNSGRFTAPVGRMAASLDALRAGAAGAGTALRRGLSGAMGLLGGPWGLALMGATALVGHFWAENAKAKAEVEALTATLDEQTGALTENSYEWARKVLLEKGALDAASRLGLNLDDVTQAALGNKDALAAVNRELGGLGDGSFNFNMPFSENDEDLAWDLREALGEVEERVKSGREEWQLLSKDAPEAMEASKDASRSAAAGIAKYEGAIEDARRAVLDLLDAENRRRNANLSARQDQLALVQAIQDTRKEMRDGKKTIDENTAAGQANLEALYGLAEQWNNSSNKVRKAKGAYSEMRSTFVEIADEMGFSTKQAEALADEILALPNRKDMAIKTPGGKEALALLEQLVDAAERLREMRLNIMGGGERSTGGRQVAGAFYSGGYTGNYATTSIAGVVHGREYVQPASVVDYYGRGFMEAIHRKQFPKVKGYRDGGLVTPPSRAATSGVVVNIGTVVAHDYEDFMRQMQKRARVSAGGGVNF